MTAPHFFVPALPEGSVVLGGDEGRHAARVLRVRPGEQISVSDGKGTVVLARVIDVAGSSVNADVIERRFVAEPLPRLVAWPAVAKNDKLDLVVQKLTELGVAEIRPWFAARSIVRWDESKRTSHGHRWRQIAFEAAKQSRRGWLPGVFDPVDGAAPSSPAVVFHEESIQRLRDALTSDPPKEISVVIGPEGGLEPAEVESFAAAGASVVSLGDQILRAETAAIAGCSALLVMYGRFA